MEKLLPDDFREFLKLCIRKRVKYLLIGGYAVGYHGYVRAISGVRFAECYRRRTLARIDGIQVNVIGRNDLIRNKKASGRQKDLDDLEHLI